MAPRAKSAQDAADTAGRREQMMRAALEVISERGYAETRIADVAERTGISPPLVIYYFKTKDQLLTEAIRYYDDTWYAAGQRRLAGLRTSAQRLEEIVAMTCLPDDEPEPHGSWTLWLDLWAQAARSPEVAAVRQKSDERWREEITALVLAGQEAGEFHPVDAARFATSVTALLDGFTVPIALGDPAVDPVTAYELCMQFISGQLGFGWSPGRGR